jgi:TolB-like protein/Flp pilus assembly protein TadD
MTRLEKNQPSIAVLAFEDMSQAKDQEYFCDGIAEEIINNLVRLGGLRVASRTSAFAFKGKQEDVRSIGQKLGVEAVLEGSVRKTEKQLRITTQLINSADGYHLWSEQYNRKMQDVFVIQEEIAQSIAQALQVELSDGGRHPLDLSSTKSIEAFDFYMRGRQFFYRLKRSYMQYAIEMFSRAIDKDSRYARAYAGKADCHSYLYWYFGGSIADLQQAIKDSDAALKLDSKLAEGHAARGLAVSLSKKYEAAEKEFELAIELNSNLFEAYYFYATNCFLQGKFDKAIDLFKKAGRVNPADYQSLAYLAFIYQSIGQKEKMAPVLQEAFYKVEQHLALNPDDSRAIYLGAGVLIRMGDSSKAMEWVKQLAATERDEPHLLYGIACLYSMTGKIEESIYYLKKAVEAGFAHRQYLEKDSDFDPIRSHPAYKALVKGLEIREKGTSSS